MMGPLVVKGLKPKKLFLHSAICMIRFDESNILLYKLVYLNSLISISTESTMSKELKAAAVVIAIILKRKNTGRIRKRRTVSVKPWLCRIIENNFK